MKILDRYLIKHFLIPTLFCAVTLIFLVIVADVFDNLDLFLKNDVTLRQTLKYYLNLTPFFYVQIIQWASFMGLLHLLVTFNVHNELTAMKVTGLQITTIIRPLIFVGFLIGVFTFIVSDRIVPYTYQAAKQIQDERIEKRKEKKDRAVFHDIAYYGSGNRLYYVKTLNLDKNRMKDFIILWLAADKKVYKKVIAREARWNGEAWELRQVNETEIARNGRIVGRPVSYGTKVYPEIMESPQEFYKSAADTRLIPYKSLKEYLARLRENGLEPYAEYVDLYERLTTPWNSLIVMLISIPLLAKTATRKSVAVNILMCIGIVFLFHVASALFLALGKSGKIQPFLSAWITSFLFGFGGLFFLEQADY